MTMENGMDENGADENVEVGAMAEALATGLVVMVAESGEDMELDDNDRVDMAELLDATVEVVVASEAGQQVPEPALEVVAGFLNENPELADHAIEMGSVILSEFGGEAAPPDAGPPEGGPPEGPPEGEPPPEEDEET